MGDCRRYVAITQCSVAVLISLVIAAVADFDQPVRDRFTTAADKGRAIRANTVS
jgi:hypothetical protein